MSNRIYLSCPMSIDVGQLEDVAEHLDELGFPVNYWKRGTKYTEDAVRYCDIFVVILPNFKFTARMDTISAGTLHEIKIAFDRGIPMFVAYRTSTGEISIYELDLNGPEVQGVTETYNTIEKYTSSERPKRYHPQEELPVMPAPKQPLIYGTDRDYDERLLLFYKH